MSLFSKPVASVYVKELRTRLDPLVVPVFTPDTAVDVGDFGSFEDGRFVVRGNVASRGLDVATGEDRVGAFEFSSSGKVSLGPTVEVPAPGGGTLLKGTVKFTKSRAVVASFKNGVERSVADADRFGEDLLKLWFGKELSPDRAVVWSLRRTSGGTVMVSQEGDNEVEVMADSALLGPAGLTLPNLALGVEFGSEAKATWKMSEPDQPLVVWARLLRLSRDQKRAVDGFGFEAPGDVDEQVSGQRPEAVAVDDLLGQLGDGA